MSDQRFEIIPEPASAPGDFYVDSNCCTACGVPQAAAPDLVGWTEGKYPQCRWIKQPQTPDEFERAFMIFEGQEFNCHRYGGADPEIKKRVGMENCGPPLSTFGYSFSASTVRPTQSKLAGLLKRWRNKRRRL